jgi:ketosteroid isomerase-like protein
MSPEEFMEQYAATGKDINKVRALLTDDALFWFSNGTAHHGLDQVAAAINYNFTTIEDDDYQAGPLRRIVRTDTCAVCVYPFHWTGKIGGKAVEGSGRGTSVLEKRDGCWLMVHEHLSKGPA